MSRNAARSLLRGAAVTVSMTIRATGSFNPASITPTQSVNPVWTIATASAGTSRNPNPAVNSPIARVSPIAGLLPSVDLHPRGIPVVQGARRAGLHDHARERPAQDPLRETRNVDQRIEIDPRRNSHVVHHMDEILGADVADRARGERASAEAADRDRKSTRLNSSHVH